MTRVEILSIVNRILFAIFFVFCCLSVLLTLQNEDEIKMAKQKDLDKEVIETHHNGLAEDESHGGPTTTQDSRVCNYENSKHPHLSLSRIKNSTEDVEHRKRHSCGNVVKKGGIYGEKEQQNNTEYLYERQGMNITENMSTSDTRPTFGSNVPRETFDVNSISQQHGLSQDHSIPYREKSKIDVLETMEAGKEYIISQNASFMKVLCLSLFKLKGFRDFLDSIHSPGHDDFVNSLLTIAKDFNVRCEYRVEPSYFEVVKNKISKVAPENSYSDSSWIFMCYHALLDCLPHWRGIDIALIEKYFHKVEWTNNFNCYSSPGVFLEENFKEVEISNVQKIKKLKPRDYINLKSVPKIFLMIPECPDTIYNHLPFSQLMLKNKIYHPKSVIIKTGDFPIAKYYTFFLRHNNSTWIMLDENGKKHDFLLTSILKSKIEICALLYEDID